MLCKNGRQTRSKGGGLFFICNKVENIFFNRQCPFSKICNITKEYIMQTDKQGRVCKDYSI